MKLLLVALVVAVLAPVQVRSVVVPDGTVWGNPLYVTYDKAHHVFVNANPAIETWRFMTHDAALRTRLLQPERIPAKRKLVLIFTRDAVTRRFPFIGLAVASAEVGKKRRFVLVNVEQTPDYDEQYRVWPHLGILHVGTTAHQEGWDVVLWDELVQGHVALDQLVQSGDVVGLSLVVTGIERGVDLARQAKALGAAYVIAGNDSAIMRANQLLCHEPAIDAVFMTNSLESVRRFFRELPTTSVSQMRIPGVAVSPMAHDYRLTQVELRAETRIRSRIQRVGMASRDDIFIVPQFDLFPTSYWETVWSNYRSQFGFKHHNSNSVRNGLALFAQGCTRAGAGDVCRYCTIYGVNDIRIPESPLLAQIVEAYQRFGIDHVFCATDSAYEMATL